MKTCSKCGLEFPEYFPECPDCGCLIGHGQKSPGILRRASVFVSSIIVLCAVAVLFYKLLATPYVVREPTVSKEIKNKLIKDAQISIVKPQSLGMPQAKGANNIELVIGGRLAITQLSINATLINTSKIGYKNASILCVAKSQNGTILTTLHKTIFSDIPPSNSVSTHDLAMGFVDQQTDKIECCLVNVERL